MRGSVIVEVAIAVVGLGGIGGSRVKAQETTSLFLPYLSPGHQLLASIVDTDHTATTYSIACSVYEPRAANGCRVPIPFYLTSGTNFMHATVSLPSTSEIRTHITTLRSIPQASEYLYSFPAYTEDAYCRLDDASAECLVTATGGALTVPMFTNRRTLAGDGFWDGWREAVVTDEMPRSYVDEKKEVKSAIGKGGEGGGEERVFRKSTVSELVQTREGGRRGGAGKVGTQPRTAGVSVPRETGRSGNAAGMGTMVTMVTTAKPVVETDVPEGAQVDIDSAGQRVVGEGGEEEDVDWVDEVVVKTKVVVETIVVTELAIVTEAHGGGGMVNGSELEEL